MNATLQPTTGPRLTLHAKTAADLMTAKVVSVRDDAVLREALILLIDKGFSAAPVIDNAGRPVGVISRSDLLIHDRETAQMLKEAPEHFRKDELKTSAGEPLGRGFQVESVDRTRVHEVMTPTVFSVPLDAPAARITQDLSELHVHRLFVVDKSGVLVGVISAMDVVRHLRP